MENDTLTSELLTFADCARTDDGNIALLFTDGSEEVAGIIVLPADAAMVLRDSLNRAIGGH